MHRRAIEKHLGRQLGKFEHVHHKNGNKLDNRLENLEVMTLSEHLSLRMTKYPVIDDSKKECGRCHMILPLESFFKRNSMLGYATLCKKCMALGCRERRARRKEIKNG